MKIKKEILTLMHETLPCYLVLQVGVKSAKRIRGQLRELQTISYISYVLLSYFSVQELSWEVLLFFLMYPWK